MMIKWLSAFTSVALLSSTPSWATNDESTADKSVWVVSGYIDGSYNYLQQSNKFTSGVYDRAFDINENGLTLQQAAITLGVQPSKGFGALFNGFLGRDAYATSSYDSTGYIGIHDVGADVLQAFVQYAYAPFTLMAGKFITLVGIESIDPTSDTNFSRSLLFAFATPDTHTGVRAQLQPNDKLKFILGLNEGWDNYSDWSHGQTVEYQIAYTPCQKIALSAQGYYGDQRVGGKVNTGAVGARNLIDLIATYNVTDKFTVAANYDYGFQRNAFRNQQLPGAAYWQGIAGYSNYKFNDTWRVSLRGEVFNDRQGYRTGVIQTIKELTLTVGLAPIKNLEFRLETRRDFSNVDAYPNRHHLIGQDNIQQSYALEGLYKFAL